MTKFNCYLLVRLITAMKTMHKQAFPQETKNKNRKEKKKKNRLRHTSVYLI